MKKFFLYIICFCVMFALFVIVSDFIEKSFPNERYTIQSAYTKFIVAIIIIVCHKVYKWISAK